MAEIDPTRQRLTWRESLRQSFVTFAKLSDNLAACGCLVILHFACSVWALLRPRDEHERVSPTELREGEPGR